MTRLRNPGLRLALAGLLSLVVFAACDDEGPPEGRVTSLAAVDGDAQTAVVATALPKPIVARALDANGVAVGGAAVEWQVTSGGGTISAPTGRTDSEGRATTTWTLGPTAGEQTATLRVGTATFVFRAIGTPAAATTMTLAPASLVLDAVGATGTLVPTARDTHGNTIQGRNPTWASLSGTVASVDANGRVTAVGPGTGRVRATLENATAEAEVVVSPVVTSILVEPPAPTMTAVGATAQMQATPRDRNNNPVAVTPGSIVWSSSNPAIVSVNATGLITAQGVGAAQVRATVGAITGSATVTVAPVAVSLIVSPKVDTLNSGTQTRQMTVQARDANNNVIPAPQVTWSSSAPNIAFVSTGGLVTAVSNGSAIIRAQSGSARDSATIVVRLNTAPKAVADVRGAVRNTQLVVAAPGLLANDTLGIPPGTILAFGGGSLGGSTTTNAAGSTANFAGGGSLRVNADGSFTFTPATNFTGAFTFNYRVQNVAGFSDAVVTIDVGSSPVAVNDTLATTVNTTLNVAAPGLMANDTLGVPAATITSFGGGTLGGNAGSFVAGNPVAFGIGGSIRINPNGSLTFTPPTGFTGVFTVQYRLTNSIGTSDATMVVNVN